MVGSSTLGRAYLGKRVSRGRTCRKVNNIIEEAMGLGLNCVPFRMYRPCLATFIVNVLVQVRYGGLFTLMYDYRFIACYLALNLIFRQALLRCVCSALSIVVDLD